MSGLAFTLWTVWIYSNKERFWFVNTKIDLCSLWRLPAPAFYPHIYTFSFPRCFFLGRTPSCNAIICSSGILIDDASDRHTRRHTYAIHTHIQWETSSISARDISSCGLWFFLGLMWAAMRMTWALNDAETHWLQFDCVCVSVLVWDQMTQDPKVPAGYF